MTVVPKISVITITYNAKDFIEATLQNVINQSYLNIEYVVIDGASNDGTLEIIERYKEKIDILVTEPDKGIYDAMNKGINNATGDYIIFMNAGDEFFDLQTIEKAFTNHNNEDFVYGDTVMVGKNGQERDWYKKKPKQDVISYRSFINGMVICHQSMFIKRSIALPYRLDLKISADIDWCVRCLKQAKTFRDSGIVIAKFLDGGLSQTKRQKAWKERFTILKQHFGLLPTLWQHGLILINAIKRGKIG